jgi:adenylyltransferase/sulfurtransferase
MVRRMKLEFSEDEISRYARHILLDEVGGVGQAKLRDARVLLIGAGGLGSPLLLYLAAAGIGTIGLADDDDVEMSNLQRHLAHGTGDVGRPKIETATDSVARLNPLVRVIPHRLRVTAENAPALIADYDIVCDGSDNFPTRFALADACWQAGKTLVSAAVLRFEGQLTSFRPSPANPCYRCLYPEAPPPDLVPSCAEAGILGAVAGVMGTLQATEVLKEILGIGTSLVGRLLIWDGLDMRFRVIKLPKDPTCQGCGGA